jgi:hypothetical protein
MKSKKIIKGKYQIHRKHSHLFCMKQILYRSNLGTRETMKTYLIWKISNTNIKIRKISFKNISNNHFKFWCIWPKINQCYMTFEQQCCCLGTSFHSFFKWKLLLNFTRSKLELLQSFCSIFCLWSTVQNSMLNWSGLTTAYGNPSP